MTFSSFSQAFMNHFSSNRIYKKTLKSLNAIWQESQEPLKEYLNRFNIAAMHIPNLEPTMELHFIKRGLPVGLFTDSLAINPLRSLAEFRERAVGYINTYLFKLMSSLTLFSINFKT